MKYKRKKNYHVGGEQMPLFIPESGWERPSALPNLCQHKLVGLDTETCDDGLRQKMGPGWPFAGMGYICGMSLAWHTDQGVKSGYYPLRHPNTDCFSKDEVVRWFKAHVEAGVAFVMHNSGYDIGWLQADLGISVLPKIHDSGCAAYMVDENRRQYNLNTLCAWRGIGGKDEALLAEVAYVYGYDHKAEMYKLPAEFIGPYAEQDAVSTLELYENLAPELNKQELVEAYQLEIDLVPMVHAMRKRGIRIDEDVLEAAYAKFKKQSQEALAEISEQTGERVSIDEVRQNKWLTEMFDRYHLTYPVNPDTGHNEFQAPYMKSNPHWLPQALVRAKSREEAAEKFVRRYLQGFVRNGRIHAQANQFKTEMGGGTRTFRFSFESPPLQQLPHRDNELAKEIRGAFLPEEGEWWTAADYSQQEVRIIVNYAELLGLTRASEAGDKYRENPQTDFHTMVAEMTGLDRTSGKNVSFAKAYGAGIKKFAVMIGQSEAKAEEIMNQYDRQMPFVKELYESCQAKAERTGFVKLLDGARCHFDFFTVYGEYENDCHREEAERRIKDPTNAWHRKRLKRSRCRKAMNSLVQGGAARQTKIAMRDMWREGFTLLLQLHDEVALSVDNESQAKKAAEIMENAVKLSIPMKVDIGLGKNWGEAK